MICSKFWAKTSPKNARGPFLVDGVAKKSLLKLANNIIRSQSRTNQHYLKDVTSAEKGKPSSCDILLLLTTTTAVSTLS